MTEPLPASVANAMASVGSLGVVKAQSWPAIAIELLLLGDERDVTAELASLPANVSPWVVEPLIEPFLEIAGPAPEHDAAVMAFIGVLAQALDADPLNLPLPMIAALDAADGWVEYPERLLAGEFHAHLVPDGEWDAARPETIEATLRRTPRLDIPDSLALALTCDVRVRASA